MESDDEDAEWSFDDPMEDEEEYRSTIFGKAKKRIKKAKKPAKRGRRAKKAPVELPDDDLDRLFDIVHLRGPPFTTVVEKWIEFYKIDRDSTLLQLIQFFIQCSGCQGKLTPEMQQSMTAEEIIEKLIEEFDEMPGGYPIINKRRKEWKTFRSNLGEFIKMLMQKCQLNVLFDQYLMDAITSILVCLSTSHIRAFRHTATLIVMKMMTGLVKAAWILTNNLDNIQHQYETERKKNRDKTTTERLELLQTKREEVEEYSDKVKNMLDYMFKTVFMHRYRDTICDIRSICIREIGVWMIKFHQVYLEYSYLRYIGWSLNDKAVSVRLSCLEVLLPLYSLEQLAERLETFTTKYKDRIVALTLNLESSVASQAVKLLISILKPPFRKPKDSPVDKYSQHVYELVYSSDRAVATTAGKYLSEHLFTLNKENVKEFKRKEGEKRSINTPLIRDLVRFYIESEIHNHGAFLVDSLLESSPMLKDWKCITDLLLEEPGPEEESLDDRQETSLIDIMICCVRQTATGKIPVGRTPQDKVLTAKEAIQVKADKAKLTAHFITVLPELLDKYSYDPEKASTLLLIPHYFDLKICKGGEMEEHLELLLKALSELFKKHTELDVLEACLKTYETLYEHCQSIRSRCKDSRNLLIDSNMEEYFKAAENYQLVVASGEELDDSEVFGLTSNLKKVRYLYSFFDLSKWELWDSLLDWVKLGNTAEDIPEDIVKHSMSSCVSSLMWKLSQLEEAKPKEVEINRSKEMLLDFMNVCREMFNNYNYVFQAEAFNTICHLLVIYRKPGNNRQPLHSLFYDIDDDLQSQLMRFIQENVFVDVYKDSHPKMEELPHRRRLLTSFCRLVSQNVIKVRDSSDIFKHYEKCFDDYGDIIKSTIKDAMEINQVNCARTMGLSLLGLFKELQSNQGATFNRKSVAFSSIKKLANRFSSSFGRHNPKFRDAVVALHRDCIVISASLNNLGDSGLPTPNLAFLEILRYFSKNLVDKDKDVILSFLDEILAPNPLWRGDQWKSYDIYRNSLLPETDDSTSSEEDKVESEDHDSDDSDHKSPSPASRATTKRKLPVKLSPRVRKVRSRFSDSLQTIMEENGMNRREENDSRRQTRQQTSGLVRSFHLDDLSEEDDFE